MLILSTDKPTAEAIQEKDAVRISIPSGSDKFEVEVTLNHALELYREVMTAARAALDGGFAAPPNADLLVFDRPAHTRRNGRQGASHG